MHLNSNAYLPFMAGKYEVSTSAHVTRTYQHLLTTVCQSRAQGGWESACYEHRTERAWEQEMQQAGSQAAAGLAPVLPQGQDGEFGVCVDEQEKSLHVPSCRRGASFPTTRQLCDDKRRYSLDLLGPIHPYLVNTLSKK